MENARLINETREALEQQTATSEVLQVINASPGDLAPVFDAMLEKAMRLCGAAFGELRTYDGERFQLAATRGVPSAYDAYYAEHTDVVYGPGTGPARILEGEPIVHIPDLVATEPYQRGDPDRHALVELGGARASLLVPLRKDRTVLGYIMIYRQEAGPFTEKQIALLHNFAAQAVIAMENARLMTETREALERQTATAEILEGISSSPTDVQPTFEAIAESAVRLCGALCGGVFRFDGSLIHLVADHGWTPDELEVIRDVFPLPAGRGSVTARAILTRSIEHVADMTVDPDLLHPSLAGIMRATLSVPMLRDGNPIGAITITRREAEPFSETQIKLVRTFADQAVIAIENTRLFNELQDRTHDLQESLEYQTATSDVLQVISRSTFDLQPVLNTLVETAAKLCSAEMGMIARREGDVYRTASTFAFSPEWEAAVWQVTFEPGRGSVIGRVGQAGETVHIPDLVADSEYAMPGVIMLGKMRTALGVPLLRQGEPIGVLYLARQRVEPFSERQIELVRTFADQAVIAVENTRLFNELQERTHDLQESLEYQTATSEVLQVISRSTFDLQPVLDTLVETAARLCDADKAVLGHLSDGLYRMAASVGFTPEYLDYRARSPIPLDRGTAIGRMLLERRVIHIEDASADPEYTDTAARDLGQFRTVLSVPLFREDAVIGGLFLARSRVEPFTERQIELVRTFADQAAIAIENTRLFNELQDRTHDLQESLEYQIATSDVLKVISRSTFDLEPVLTTVAETAARLCDAEQAYVSRRDGDVFRYVTAVGSTPESTTDALRFKETYLDAHPIVPGRGNITGRVLADHQPVQIADITADPEYKFPEAFALAKIRSLLGVPLLRESEPIGVLNLARQRVEPFSERQIELVRTFADQAVIAIENTRLFNELQERTRDLQESLEYQTATSDVLQVISRSTFDLQPVLNTLVETAAKLCNADLGHLFRREAEGFRGIASFGLAPGYREWVEEEARH